MLRRVGLPRPAERLDAYSFQLSGGMRQRAMIAMALVNSPGLLIADEPTTALDVTTQAQILELMRALQAEFRMSMLFITHDLGVVAEMADEVAVMYLGNVVERGSVDQVFHDPRHPYTRALLRSNPRHGQASNRRLHVIAGSVPDPLHRPARLSVPQPVRRSHLRALRPAGDRALRLPSPPATPLAAGSPTMRPRSGASHPLRVGRMAVQLRDRTRDTAAADRPGTAPMHFPAAGAGLLRRSVSNAARGRRLLRRTSGAAETLGPGRRERLRQDHDRPLHHPHPGSDRGPNSLRSDDGRTVDVARLPKHALRTYHRQVRMIFQDPYSSLDPRMTVADIIGEPLQVNHVASGQELQDRVASLVRRVGLRPEHMRRYPHAFSGGERQRIGIARALSLDPRLVVCDEAVSALDVSVQAQILNLLRDLQDELDLTYLFIAHDLSVVRHICDRVAVMYAGRVVELGATQDVFENPQHPYTAALLSAAPAFDPEERARRTRIIPAGEVPDPAHLPTGCSFHPRCPHSDGKRCVSEAPALAGALPDRQVACHYADRLSLPGIGAGVLPERSV